MDSVGGGSRNFPESLFSGGGGSSRNFPGSRFCGVADFSVNCSNRPEIRVFSLYLQ